MGKRGTWDVRGDDMANWPLSGLHQGTLLPPELNSSALLLETKTKAKLRCLLSTYKALELNVCNLN